MDPALNDPRNHIPEVSPDDEWGDAEAIRPEGRETGTVLPPKREHATAPPATKQNTKGLRIESNPASRRSEKPEQSLEVKEISGSVVRLNPEEPTAEKMPRQHSFQQRPAASTEQPWHRAETQDWGKPKKHALRWILGASFGVISMIIGAMILLPLINKSNAQRTAIGPTGLEPVEPTAILTDQALEELILKQAEAEQIFRFFACQSIVDDILPVIRNSESVEHLIRSHHQPGSLTKDWLPPEDTTWNVFYVDGLPFGVMEGKLPDYSGFTAYLTLTNDTLLLDWRATTGYGTATFDELSRNQGDSSEIRGWISPTVFYSTTFPEGEYQSYRFVSPDKGTSIWCYVSKSDPAAKSIGKLFQSGTILANTTDPKKVTLQLTRGPSGALLNQWLIEDLHHNDWITP